jgi:hypothetical protein
VKKEDSVAKSLKRERKLFGEDLREKIVRLKNNEDVQKKSQSCPLSLEKTLQT